MKRSTRPSVSTIFCVPVKNGWHLLQMSSRMAGFVDRVVKVRTGEEDFDALQDVE